MGLRIVRHSAIGDVHSQSQIPARQLAHRRQTSCTISTIPMLAKRPATVMQLAKDPPIIVYVPKPKAPEETVKVAQISSDIDSGMRKYLNRNIAGLPLGGPLGAIAATPGFPWDCPYRSLGTLSFFLSSASTSSTSTPRPNISPR